jgi:ferredoxin
MPPQDVVSPSRLRPVANRSACCGYGVCSEICPQIFGLDDNGIVTLKVEWVPAGLEEKAREAAQACPQSALEIEELPG